MVIVYVPGLSHDPHAAPARGGGMKDRLRVMHIITQLDGGGAQDNTLYTVEHLDRMIFSPSLSCGPNGSTWNERARALDCPVYWIEHMRNTLNPIYALLAFFQIRKAIEMECPDIVHTHSSFAGMVGRLAAWSMGIQTVIHTVHGWSFNARQPRWKSRLFIWIEQQLSNITTKLIFVAKTDREIGKDPYVIYPEYAAAKKYLDAWSSAEAKERRRPANA